MTKPELIQADFALRKMIEDYLGSLDWEALDIKYTLTTKLNHVELVFKFGEKWFGIEDLTSRIRRDESAVVIEELSLALGLYNPIMQLLSQKIAEMMRIPELNAMKAESKAQLIVPPGQILRLPEIQS